LINVLTQSYKLAMLAWSKPDRCFTTLHHYLTLDWLLEAYQRTRKTGACGVDKQTGMDYAQNLEANLSDLLRRVKSGTYKAPPVKRVYIPKANGKQRPIGIPTFEDKLLQRAVVMILECIYEADFLDSSYGFRPRRNCHSALSALRDAIRNGGDYLIELDIESFFDKVNKKQLKTMLQHRIGDGIILRLLHKWLNAGVMEKGQFSFTEAGTPQGGVISPLLANIYLHYVLDNWFERDVKPRLWNRAELIRFADDAVLAFRSKADCDRVMKVIGKRFNRYSLRLHPEKTSQLTFKPSRMSTFNFLGFTHYWGKSRRGKWTVKRKTAKGRQQRALKSITEWCRSNRHQPIEIQHKQLSRKIVGHYNYFGINGNGRALTAFRHWVERIWLKWLRRRSQRARCNWEIAWKMMKRYSLPSVRIYHPTV
jgi:RNA-directed DNA polymerase